MKVRKTFGVLMGLALVLATTLPALAGPVDNPNHEDYWKAQYPNAVACYKYEPGDNSAHGHITQNGKAVVLNQFQQNWPGDRWEVLIVKGGAQDVGHGKGNEVYELPDAGKEYFPPLNNGGNKPDVSHWIVCKGETPTTTTTTVPETTTTQPEITTTTVPEETTTTQPEVTTTVPETTTTEPEQVKPFCVDANTASLDQLIAVDGLNGALGQRVIDARPFAKPIATTIQNVSGIGSESSLDMLQPNLPDNPGYLSDECLTVEIITTTTIPEVTTTVPEEPTTTVTTPPTTVPPTTTPTTTPEKPTELPFTGPEGDPVMMASLATGLLLAGLAGLGFARRRKAEDI